MCMGAVGIGDDIKDFGNNNTYYLPLHEAVERTRKAGIKFNYRRCIVNKNIVASLRIFTLQKV